MGVLKDDLRESETAQAGTLASVAMLYGVIAAPAFLLLPPLSPADSLAGLVLAAVLVVLTAIDLREFRLPDVLTLPLALIGIGFAGVLGWEPPLERIAAVLAGFGALYVTGAAYLKLRGQAGIGTGDAKLFGASGAWVGLGGLASVLFAACLLAAAYLLVLAARGHVISGRTMIAFGPFLAAGTWVVWIYGPFIW